MNRRIDFHPRQFERLTRELKPRLFEMIGVQVRVSESVNELAGFQIAGSSDHHGEQRVRSNVEGQAQEDIGRTLIELTRQLSVRNIELEEQVTRRQSHFRNLAYVPGADYQPTRIWIRFNLIDHLTDLIYRASI